MSEITAFKTSGGSMRPFLKSGGFLIVEKLRPDKLNQGDTVLYRLENKYYAHRIWKIKKNTEYSHLEFIIGDDAAIIGKQNIPTDAVLGIVINSFNNTTGICAGKLSNFVYNYGRRFKNFFKPFLVVLCVLALHFSTLYGATRIKTVEWNLGINDSASINSGTIQNFPTINFRLPDALTVKKAWLEVDGLLETNHILAGADIYFDQSASASTIRDTILDTTLQYTTDESMRFNLKCDIPTDVFANVTSFNDYAAAFKPIGSKSQALFSLLAIKLYVTYEYDDQSAIQINTVRFPLKSNSGASVASTLGIFSPGLISFEYKAEIGEEASPNFAVKHQWFEIRGHRLSNGSSADGTIFARIASNANAPTLTLDGSLITSYDFLYLTSAGIQNGFAPNIIQTLNILTTQNPIYNIGGECVVTYEFSKDAATKTKTVNYLLGQALTSGSAYLFPTRNIFLEEDGIIIKSLYARIHGTYNSATAANVTWRYSVNGSSGTPQVYSHRTMAAQVGHNPFYLDLWSAYLAAGAWSNGVGIAAEYIPANTSNTGVMGAELTVTYQYSSDNKFTDTYKTFAYQAEGGAITSTSLSFPIFTPTVETVEGRKTINSGYLSGSFNIHADGKTINNGYTITQDLNSSSSEAHDPRSASESMYSTALYTDPLGLITANNTTLTANVSVSANNIFPNACANVTYSYFPVPSSPTVLGQYKTDEVTVISSDTWTNQSSVLLNMEMFSRISDTLSPEIEVKPVVIDFDGTGLLTGSSVIYPGTGVVIGTVSVTGLTDGTTYHWRARVTSINGNSLWSSFGDNSETFSDFGIDISSPTTTLVLPLNSSTTNQLNIAFNWTGTDLPAPAKSGINNYEFDLSTDAGFGLIYYSSTTNNTSITTLLQQSTFYWRVRTNDNAGNTGDWSSFSLLIDTTPPTTAALIDPLDEATTNQLNINFQWGTSDDSGTSGNSGVSGYEFYVSTTVDFSVFTSSELTSLNSISRSLDQDLYYWHVRPIDNVQNTGSWSSTWSILIDSTPPPTPSIISPASDFATNLSPVNLTWGDVNDSSTGNSGLNYYNLQVSESSDFSPLFYSSATINLTVPVDFAQSSTYYWQVSSVDNAGNSSDWSGNYFLQYDTAAPKVSNDLIADSEMDPPNFRNSDPGSGFINIDFTDTLSRLNELKYSVTSQPDGSGETLISWTPIETSPVDLDSYNADWDVVWASLAEWATNYVHIYYSDRAGNNTTDYAVYDILKDTTSAPAPDLISPAEQYITNMQNISFDWTDSQDLRSGTSNYILDVATSSDFGNILYSSITAISQVQINNFAQDSYFWRAAAYDKASNPLIYSSTRTFIVSFSLPEHTIGLDLINGDTTWVEINEVLYAVDFNDMGGSKLDRFEIRASTIVGGTPPLLIDWTDSGVNINGVSSYIDDWPLSDIVWQTLETLTTNYISLRTFDLAGNTSEYIDAFFIKKATSSISITVNESIGEDSVWHSTNTERSYNIDFFGSETVPLKGIEYRAYSKKNGEIGGGTQIFDWTALPGPVIETSTNAYNADWQIGETEFDLLWNNATNYISVRCWNTLGTTVTATDVFFVKKDTSPPTIPVLSVPLNSSATNQQNISFSWLGAQDLASGTTLYYIQVSTSLSFMPLAFSSSIINTNIISDTLSESTYFWRIMAKDLAGNESEYSSAFSVQLDTTAPQAPDLTSPLSGFTTNYVTQTFQWGAVPDYGPAGMSHYQLNISTSDDFSIIYHSTNTFGTSYTTNLDLSSTYYWNIRSFDRAGNYSVIDSTEAIVVDTISPQMPSLNSPSENFTTSVIDIAFVWTGADIGPSGIKDYTLEVSTDILFNPVIYSTTTTLLSATTSFDEGRYWYRAISRDIALNYSQYSDTRSFAIDISSPPAPSFNSPTDDTRTNSLQLNFSWDVVTDSGPAGINSYQLLLSTDSGFGVINYSSQTTDNSALIDFTEQNIFYYKTRALDNVGYYSEFSSTFSVTIDTTSPTTAINQTGDDTWRSEDSKTYDVDFLDTPETFGSGIKSAWYRVFSSTTVSGEPAGTELISYQQIFDKSVSERTTYYSSPDWNISVSSWNKLNEGYNFVFVKSSDMAGNFYEKPSYAFYVKKDTSAPSLINYETTKSWENSGRLYDLDFIDSYSSVRVSSYTAYPLPAKDGSPTIGWTTIFDSSPAIGLWDEDWSINFDLLLPGTNYISIRSDDDAGNTISTNDLFTIWKDTIVPESLNDLTVSAGTLAGSLDLSWTAPADDIITDSGNNTLITYIVKYNISPFADNDDFLSNGTTHYQEWIPKNPGNTELYPITDLVEGTTYYFGVIGTDKASNRSYLSAGSINQFWATRIPPSPITDLEGFSPDTLDPGAVQLTWTAVGDDTNVGTASGYVVKYATYQFIPSEWATITEYSQSWDPLPSGSMEDRIVAGLGISTTYYFAIKAYDDASPEENYSVISNTAIAQSRPKGPADGMLCFGEGTLAYPRYRMTTSAGASWENPANANVAQSTIYWSVLRTCPVFRNEKIIGTLSSGGAIYTQKWDGVTKTWNTPSLETTIATSDAVYRVFDMSYEQNSGRAMLVYRSVTGGQVYYKVWSSTASAWVVNATPLTMGGSGLVRWVRLEPRPGTNEIMLVTIDTNNDMFAYRWNGTSWVNNRQLTLTAYSATYQSFDIAWENSRGNCLILWGEGKNTNYAMWSSTAALWSTVGTAGPGIGAVGGAYWIKLAADRKDDSNNIAMSSLDNGSDWNVSVWNGATWANSYELSSSMDASTSRLMDIAWEKDTGKFIAVGAVSANPASYFSYTTWKSGDAWPPSAPTLYDLNDIGSNADLCILQLVSDPNSNKMVLLGSNSKAVGSVNLNTIGWTGSGWAGGTPLSSVGSNGSYEFFSLSLDRHDLISPSFNNTQTGDNIWRSTNNGFYSTEFHDTGGSLLSRVQTQLAAGPSDSGIYRTWTDELTGLNLNDYITPWPLSATTWDQLQRGQTYISLKVFDGVGNNLSRTDAFYVFKDTELPSINNILKAATTWYNENMTPGVVASADFTDQAALSLLSTAQYLIYPQSGIGGTKIAEGNIFGYSPATPSKSANINIIQNDWNLLVNSTNYVTLRCFDAAGNTTDYVDAFTILKDTIPPQDINSLQVAEGPYRGTVDLSWLAPGDDGALLNNSEGKYLIKYASYPITDLTLFNGASTYAQSLIPKNAGSLETITLMDLDVNTTCYFAVETRDKALLWSGISNSTGTIPRIENIYVNEVYSAGTPGNDWIELYNSIPDYELMGSSLIYNLGTIDAPGSESIIKTWPVSTIVTSGTFILIDSLNLDGSAGRHVKLLDNLERTVDIVQWPALSAEQSFARISDGNYDYFEIDTSSTMNQANSISTGTIKINEIDYASSQQFIELYNTGTDTTTLTGWTLRNSNGNPFKFTRTIYPETFTGIDFSSKDNALKTWNTCFGAGGLNSESDFIILENPEGQVIDRVTWNTGSELIYYDHKANNVLYNTSAGGGIASPMSIGRKTTDGADTLNNIDDFGPFTASTYGSRNNNPSPALSNTLNYPPADSYLPRRFKTDITLGENSVAGQNDTLWFIRTGGTSDDYSPHIYRLTDNGINLATSLTAQATDHIGLSFNDLAGNPLIDGAIYKMILNTDSGQNCAPQIVRNNITYEAAEHNIQITGLTNPYFNNEASEALFKIAIANQSPSSANSIELSTITVRFTDAAGVPLNTSEAQALFGSMSIVVDDTVLGTQGTYQSDIDSSTVANISSTSFSLDGTGAQVIGVSNPDLTESNISAQDTRNYFFKVYIASNAHNAAKNTFKAKLTAGSTETILRDGPSDIQEFVQAGTEVITSSPTIIQPAKPPAGTVFPAKVTTSGTDIKGSIMINYLEDMAFAATSDGKLYAIGNDGSPKWSFDAGSPITTSFETSRFEFEPSTSIYLATQSGLLYKLSYNDSTCVEAWGIPRNLGSAITSEITYASLSPYLYIGTGEGKLYKIGTDGSDANGWNNSPDISGGITAIPIIDEFTVAVNAVWFGTNAGTIYRLNNVDATVTSLSNTSTGINTSPFLNAGLFDSSKNTHNIYFGDDDGVLRCRTSSNLSTKPALWEDVSVGSPIHCSPVYDDDHSVYFGSDNGTFYKVDYSSGGIYWTFQTGGPIRSMPVYGGNSDIYFGSDDGCLYGLNTENGTMLPNFPIRTGGEIRTAITFYSNGIYFGSRDGKVYCVEIP